MIYLRICLVVVTLLAVETLGWADTLAARLDQAIQAVAPIYGVSIGKRDDKTTWHIQFKPEATREQREAARATLQAFDPMAPAPKSQRELKREALLSDQTVPQSIKDWVAAQ